MIGHLRVKTFNILSESVQESSTTGSIVEPQWSEQDGLQHTYLLVTVFSQEGTY